MTSLIPKLSSPLAKGIRTTEGILTSVVGGMITAASLIDPHALPKKESAILLAGLSVLYTIQRGLIKVVALQKGLGVGAPIDDAKLDHTVAAITDQAASVSQLVDQHKDIAEDLNNLVAGGHLPTKEQLDTLLQQLEKLANPLVPAETPAPATPEPVETPEATVAATEVTPDEEAAVQPPVSVPESAIKPDEPVST
jgi:hypothetical protein